MTKKKSTHGGSRPKARPDDKRGGARRGAGRLPKKVIIEPFLARKSDTVSECRVVLHRCNYCGAYWMDPYSEDIMGWTGGEPTLTIEHDGIEEAHKERCVKVTGPQSLPKFKGGDNES